MFALGQSTPEDGDTFDMAIKVLGMGAGGGDAGAGVGAEGEFV